MLAGVLVTLLVLLVLAIGVLYWAARTSAGTEWTLERFTGEDLRVAEVEGRLVGPLVLHDVRYRAGETEVRIDRVALEWRPRSLFRGRARVTGLDVDGVDLVLPEEDPEETAPFELPDIEVPRVSVFVDRASVSDIRIQRPGADEPLVIGEVRLTAMMDGAELVLDELAVESTDYRGRIEGGLTTEGDYPMDLQVDWWTGLPESFAVAGQGRLTGSLAELHVDQRLTLPIEAQVDATVHDATDLEALRWEAEVDVPQFALATLREDLAPHELGFVAAASGDLSQVSGSADISAWIEQVGPVAGDAHVDYANDEIRLEALDLSFPEMGGGLAASGTASLGGEAARFDLSGDWRDIDPPEVPIESSRGSFTIAGTSEQYDLRAQGQASGDLLPNAVPDVLEGEWMARGQGSDSAIDLQLNIETLGGQIEGEGSIAWVPALQWDFTVDGVELSLESLVPDWGGTLSVGLASRGGIRDGALTGDFTLDRITGDIGGMEVNARSDIGVRDGRIEVRELVAQAGGAELSAEGTVGDAWSLEWALDAPEVSELSRILGPARGALRAEGEVTGERATPRVMATLDGDSVGIRDMDARRVEATLDVDFSDSRLSTVDVRLEEARAGFLASAIDAELQGSGTTDDHALMIRLSPVDGGSLAMTLEGGLQGQAGQADTRWVGALSEMTLDPRDMEPWVLQEPAPLGIGPDSIALSRACLLGGIGEEACAEGAWDPAAGARGQLSTQAFPLRMVSRWIPDLEVDGNLDLEADAVLPPDDALQVEVVMDAGSGTLRYSPAGVGPVVREYEALTARVDLNGGALAADALFRFTDSGFLEGEIRAAPGESPEEQTLSGYIRGTLEDRGFAGFLAPQLSRTEGRIELDLSPAGTRAVPELTGSLSLRDGAADMIPLGVRLEEVSLDLETQGGGAWEAAGSVRSGAGTLAIEGELTVPSLAAPDSITGDFTVRGERFLAYNTVLATVVASPELGVRLVPGRLEVRGNARIPEAEITPRDLEGAVGVSQDVVIVQTADGPDEAEEEAAPLDLFAEVRVVMGDEVELDGFGVTGRLEGDLIVEIAPGQAPLGRGELQVVEGEYTALGQTLEIDRGRLLYADGVLTNPRLDIRVVRETGDVVAGMEIEGTAETPRAELFSEPAMPEADVLSYLVLGRPATLAGEEEGDALGQAASALGVAGAQQIAERLGGGVLGLEEARVEAEEGEGLEGATLVLGTYLSPRLWVGYGIGLFDATNVLRVRYQLGTNWLLQTESGAHTGADIIYTIERR